MKKVFLYELIFVAHVKFCILIQMQSVILPFQNQISRFRQFRIPQKVQQQNFTNRGINANNYSYLIYLVSLDNVQGQCLNNLFENFRLNQIFIMA
ncbi:unnamed protein product [Paramecium sonneborni]|uniref:Uncharacterized protein n=1 Tax=Paramecium sonneborni TaxID=65129 RepID=A0A8S1R6M6_9CILI|nr:unnamed protein product [Paramecium sonneborni]